MICPICLGRIKGGNICVRLTNGRIVHVDCLKKWYERGGK